MSFAGYQAVARAVLDTLGYADIPVPAKLKLPPLPGLVTPWRIRAAKPDEPALDEASVPLVKPDDTWQTLNLPETEPQDSWWPDQVRQEGYAMSLEKFVGKADHYIGVAVVLLDELRKRGITRHHRCGSISALLHGHVLRLPE